MKNFYIYLIRHGLTESNLLGRYCGSQNDEPLCGDGVERLNNLVEIGGYPLVEQVYTSPMTRARETANILYPDFDHNVVDGLSEADFGKFSGLSIYELRDDPDYQRWVTPNSDYTPEGVEPPRQFYKRNLLSIFSIIDEMISTHTYSAAVITHASVIGNIMSGIALPKKPPYDWGCDDGCGFKLATNLTLWQRDGIVEVLDYVPCGERGEEDEDEF